jgi:hypothetical protein
LEVIGGVISTPTKVCSYPYNYTHVFALREINQATNLGTNYSTISKRAVAQREITKTMQKSQKTLQAHE